MMNDRFSAELRRHLLTTANERTADGQLAALAEQVAVTPQRRPLVALLTWNPGRIGPFPSKAIRYGLIAAALALAAVVGAILAGSTKPAPSTVFEGTWITIDPADGSGVTLAVGPGKTPAVFFEDGYATGAACVSDPVKRFTARGTGEISGDRLVASYPDGGGCGLRTVDIGGRYDYQPGSDTLVDQDGVIWSRALGGDQPATQGPATDAPATEVLATDVPATESAATEVPATAASSSDPSLASATPVPACIDFNGGGTYNASVGDLSLNVTVPTAADKTWVGLRDSFYLERASCGSIGFARLQASLVSQVYADACHRAGTRVKAWTAAEAAEALAAQPGLEVLLYDDEMTLGGYPARYRFMSIENEFDATGCDDGALRFWLTSEDAGASFDPGWNVSVFLVDVEESVLAISASRLAGDEEEVPLVAELDSMVSSLRIEP